MYDRSSNDKLQVLTEPLDNPAAKRYGHHKSNRTHGGPMPTIHTEGDLDDARQSARLVAVINAWSAAGLFSELADGPTKLDELSGDQRAIRITARILGNAGILVRRKETWALTPSGEDLYDDGVFGGYQGLEYFRELSKLDEVLADGGPVPDEDGERNPSTIGAHPDDPQRTRAFMEMLSRRSARSAKATARWIDHRFDGPAQILDLGGGHGRYGRELAELGHDVAIFDLPVCIEVAREMHGDSLEYIAGDFFIDDLGGPYDAVLASNIVHGLSADDNRRLAGRVADALDDGGEFILKDMFLDEFEMWPPNAAYFALIMLMYTEDGDTYGIDEVRDWFQEAGLEMTEPVVFESYSLVSGRR